MEKHELVSLTLDHLLDHYSDSPESFEWFEGGWSTVVWRPKIQMDDITSNIVQDPNNAHCVVVRFSVIDNSVTCYVFLAAPTDPLQNLDKADSKVVSCRMLEKWRSNYRKLIKLKKLIAHRDQHRANITYLRRLTSVFPDALDKHFK